MEKNMIRTILHHLIISLSAIFEALLILYLYNIRILKTVISSLRNTILHIFLPYSFIKGNSFKVEESEILSTYLLTEIRAIQEKKKQITKHAFIGHII